MNTTHPLPALALEVRHLLPSELPVHLVGGAVRDWLLQRPVVDLDFVVPDRALKWARRIADDLDADFFPLDPRRGIGRVLIQTPEGRRIIDIANYRAPTLEEDLRLRDFTINAMALDPLRPDQLIDPTGGLQDLLDRRLRPCTSHALVDDPVRVLRAVRLALDLDLSMDPETRRLVRNAVPHLNRVSPERVREELFKIFALKKVPAALRVLGQMDALHQVLPEVAAMRGVRLPDAYGEDDLWDHTLHTLERVQDLRDALLPPYDPDKVANILLAQVSWRLGRYRFQLDTFWKEPLAGYRPRKEVFVLGVLYHDAGKVQVAPEHPDPDAHARAGASLVRRRAHALRLARSEIRWLERLVRYHMWPQRFAKALPTPRDLYRFFRETDDAGVAVGWLHLANLWSKGGFRMNRDTWEHHVDVVRRLWEAWWERREEWLHPRPLLSGDDLIREFGLTPGPVLGQLLEALKEAQVAGEVATTDQARHWVEQWLKQQGENYGKISSNNGS